MKFKQLLSFFSFPSQKKESNIYSEMDNFFTSAIKEHDLKTITSMMEAGYKVNASQKTLMTEQLSKALKTSAPYIGKRNKEKRNPLYGSEHITSKSAYFNVNIHLLEYLDTLSKHDVFDDIILNNLSEKNAIGNFFNIASSLMAHKNIFSFDLNFSLILEGGNSNDSFNQNTHNYLNKWMKHKGLRMFVSKKSYDTDNSNKISYQKFLEKRDNFSKQLKKLFSLESVSKINYLSLNPFNDLDFDMNQVLNPKINIPFDKAINDNKDTFLKFSPDEFYSTLNQLCCIVFNRIVKNLEFGDSSVISEEILDGRNLYSYLLFNNSSYQFGTTASHYDNDIGNKVLAEIDKERKEPLTLLIPNQFLNSLESQITFMNEYTKHFHSSLYIHSVEEKKEVHIQNDLDKYLEILRQKKQPENSNVELNINYKNIIIESQFTEEVTQNLLNTLERKDKILQEYSLTDNESKLLKTIESKIFQLIELKDLVKTEDDSHYLEHSKVIFDEVFQLEFSLLSKKTEEMTSKIEDMKNFQQVKRTMLKS